MLIYSFADLKKYKFHYWVGYPALVPETPFVSKEVAMGDWMNEHKLTDLKSFYEIIKVMHI